MIKRILAAGLALALFAVPTASTVVSAQAASSPYDAYFSAASKDFHVPANVLKAISYTQTRWSNNNGAVSITGGYGIMNLTANEPLPDNGEGKGDGSATKPLTPPKLTHYTLDEASALLGKPSATLKTDPEQNIRGAAAVLAKYATSLNNGKTPTDSAAWYSAIAAYSGATTQTMATGFTDDVYDTLRNGAQGTDDNGTVMTLPATAVEPQKDSLSKLSLQQASPTASAESSQQGAECPPTLNCRFIPAAYANTDPKDPSVYGNYDPANRPKDMDIKFIFIHDTEGSYDSAIARFQDPTQIVSANYVIRSKDGAITQMVHNQDVSFGIGNFYYNMKGINIEHEGMAAQGSKWYTPAMYKSSSTLVRWLAQKYNIPLDRNHILGHDNVPAVTQDRMAGQHWDPGPFWDWNGYMNMVKGATGSATDLTHTASPASNVITMAPNFATNKMSLQDCYTTPGACKTLPNQGTSVTYLHTQPNATSPLLTDKSLHPDGKPGAMEISDWSASASSGQQYVVAGKQGTWMAIWFNGQKGWFNNPVDKPIAYYSTAPTIMPKAGAASIPTYGRPVPEASAFPSGVTPIPVVPLAYTIPAGQAYTAIGGFKTDYYYDATFNYSKPHDHEIFVGKTKYYQIQYNHRMVYVKASDVQATGL